MANLVIVSGDFASGSTFLWTLFRKTGEFYCLYEPLHPSLPEFLLRRVPVYAHHFFVDDYYAEYRGFRDVPRLLNPSWGVSSLYLPAAAQADDLHRYLSYLIGMAFARSPKVLIKENRLTFRLDWVRAVFPQAKIVHIYRDPKAQWDSIVRRVQLHFGREDVGQDRVMFDGFSIATWCEDLKAQFPELDASNFRTGYERYLKLAELSRVEHGRYADISVDYRELVRDFGGTCSRLRQCVGCAFDLASLRHLVVPPEGQKPLSPSNWTTTWNRFVDRAWRRYAKSRLLARAALERGVEATRQLFRA